MKRERYKKYKRDRVEGRAGLFCSVFVGRVISFYKRFIA
jgi:hypothetical protein